MSIQGQVGSQRTRGDEPPQITSRRSDRNEASDVTDATDGLTDSNDGFEIVARGKRSDRGSARERIFRNINKGQDESNARGRPRWGVVFGSSEDTQIFKAVPVNKKHWFHLSRLPPDMHEDTVKDYMKAKFDLTECICERVTPSYVENSTFSSFKVGIEASKSAEFLTPDMWPRGVAISRWRFSARKSRNKQPSDSTSQGEDKRVHIQVGDPDCFSSEYSGTVK